jgi:hypothetical protein
LWIRIPDPGSSAFLTPGSGIDKKSGSLPGSYFLELRNHLLGLKYLNSLMRIRDPDPRWKNFGFGIRDGKTSLIRNTGFGNSLSSCYTPTTTYAGETDFLGNFCIP